MINKRTKKIVFHRAQFICEYCLIPASHTPQSFNGEHIIPVSKNGTDDLDNLACACGGCNSSKSDKTHARDPFDRKIVPLFHPRQMLWYDHFVWSPDCIEVRGITPTGRATVQALNLNRAGLMNLRHLLFKARIHPPKR